MAEKGKIHKTPPPTVKGIPLPEPCILADFVGAGPQQGSHFTNTRSPIVLAMPSLQMVLPKPCLSLAVWTMEGAKRRAKSPSTSIGLPTTPQRILGRGESNQNSKNYALKEKVKQLFANSAPACARQTGQGQPSRWRERIKMSLMINAYDINRKNVCPRLRSNRRSSHIEQIVKARHSAVGHRSIEYSFPLKALSPLGR